MSLLLDPLAPKDFVHVMLDAKQDLEMEQDTDELILAEVWDASASHKASLSLPAVQQAMVKGKALIAGFGERFETQPMGGAGLVRH